jgi:hypothetical protein
MDDKLGSSCKQWEAFAELKKRRIKMDKIKIAVNDLVYYRSTSGNQCMGRVHKVNRVNSKVEVLAVNGWIKPYRSQPAVVNKVFLRRATPDMVELAQEYEL